MSEVVAFPGATKAPVPQPGVEPAIAPNANKDVIAALEEFLVHAKQGEIDSVMILGWSPGADGFFRKHAYTATEQADTVCFRYLGGLDLLKRDLQEIAFTRYETLKAVITDRLK